MGVGGARKGWKGHGTHGSAPPLGAMNPRYLKLSSGGAQVAPHTEKSAPPIVLTVLSAVTFPVAACSRQSIPR